MEYELCYGKSVQKVNFPDEDLLDILLPNEVPVTLKGEEEIVRALLEPIGTLPLESMVKRGEKIVIITSDITRPMPSWRVLPFVLEKLHDAGIPDEDITIVFALGSHRKHSEQEKRRLVGNEIYNRIRCVDSSDGEYVLLGTTSRGTPVEVAEPVARADFRICLGNIEYHYFAGYSGGAKALMPGVSNRKAIQANHRWMMEESARAGNLSGNIIREDIEESTRSCPIDFILNVILDENKEIIKAVAGDVLEAHRVGCKYVDQLYQKKISQKADIVIASMGGAPKDINLYQTQKALENAARAVKKGGAVILVGACEEGFGNSVFEQWLLESDSTDSIIRRIEEKFQLGGHKAAAIAKILKDADVYLVSEIPKKIVNKAFLKSAEDVQSAFEDAKKARNGNVKVYLMPFAGSTLPCCSENEKKGKVSSKHPAKENLMI